MTPRELLNAAADAAPDSPERALFVTAAVGAILDRRAVLVGGSAVNTYTNEYRPTDIDIVAAVGARERQLLTEYGFVDPGPGHRHLQLPLDEGPPVLVEFPSGGLAGEEVEEIALGSDAVALVIALTDLVVDRLRQATDGTLVTFEDAVALAAAAHQRINWQAVETRVASAPSLATEMADAMQRVRAAVDVALG